MAGAHRQLRESSSSSSSYMVLLNSLASDLDYMLSDLCTTPPPPYENGHLSVLDGDIVHLRGDAFLEPYMQGLGPDFTSPHHHHHLSSKTPEGGSVTSSPAGDGPNNHNTKTTLADLSAPFRLLELDGSADSLDQEQDSSLSSGSGSSGGDSRDAPCDIGLVERLIRSHPVWFLPGIQRAGAFHLLQSKEEGNFVVRQSSQPDTMAISVRLPAGKGPYIEHYLIQAVDGQLSLESSDNRFDNIPQLIAHYSQCCDELPVQLSLPRAMREAKNRQQLSSLALLGQVLEIPDGEPPSPERSQVGVEMTTLQQSPPSSGSSLSSLGSGNNNNHLNSSSTNTGAQTPTSELGGDAIVLNLTPLYSVEPLQTPSLLTTFKGSDITANNTSPTVMSSATIVVTSSSTATNVCTASVSRGPRPTPPNTLNLVCSASSQTATLSAGVRSSNSSPAQQVTSPPSCNGDGGSSSRSGPLVVSGGGKTPPPPPPRWAKPTALSSGGQNFTVTTTVTFSVNNTTPPPHVEVSCVQVAPKQSQIEDGHLTTSSHSSTLDQRSMRLHQVVSPSTPTETTKLPANNRVKKHRPNHLRQSSVKESHHYQESDILDSPTVYYRSSVADKFSDYEDIWGPEMLSTFKPTNQIPRSSPFSSPEDISSSSGGISKRTPDLLERIGTPVSGSCISLNSGSNNLKEQKNRLGLVINTNTCNSNSHSPLSPPSDGKSDGPAASNHTKQGSPFYAEPADALKQSSVIARRRPRVVQSAFPHHQPRNHRHSDPTFFQQWPASTSYHAGGLERIDSTEELPLSSSVDNLALLKNSRNITATQTSGGNKPKGKPVQPPRVRPSHGAGKSFNDTSWAVDSSWEFIGNEDEGVDGEGGEERERRFPSLEQQETSLEEGEVGDIGHPRVTVQELIAQRFPELLLSPDTVSTVISPNRGPSDIDSSGFSSRMSSYDNVEGRNLHHDSNHHHLNVHNAHPCGSHISDDDTQTIFSEPWDSSRWENLLHMESSESVSNSAVQESSAERLLVPEGNALCDAPSNQSIVSQVKRSKSFKERLDPLLSPPRLQALRSRELNGTGASIRAYALHLSADKSTTFAQNIDNFIACTCESRETSPQVVMRNMRQFMSGMKNYLVKHGEREFEKEVEKERVKLKANEFLNLDAILEGVMHKLVVRPLREHLYQLFVDEYTRSGAIQLLADNMRYARTKPAHELGIRPEILAPSGAALETICYYLTRLQEVDSPLEKLENLLTCISAIFNSVKSCNQGRGIALGADDFLPLFVWVLVQSGMMAAEIEAEYMWGLLHPSLLSGEGGYYLTTLSSAVHVLKNFRACSEEQSRAHGAGLGVDVRVGLLADFRSVLKIVVPDEVHGSIITKTLPVRPNMTTRDVCKIIAHKVRITNPQDYGLFKLVDGEETLLNDGECPQDIKGIVSQVGKHCMFAYKRIDAKIAWPTTSSSS